MQIERITGAVCYVMNITPAEVMEKDKTRLMVAARDAISYISRVHGGFLLKEIGSYLNLHHSTIVYAVENAVDKMKTDPGFREVIVKSMAILGITAELPEPLFSGFTPKTAYEYRKQRPVIIEPEKPKEDFSWRKPSPAKFAMMPKFSRV